MTSHRSSSSSRPAYVAHVGFTLVAFDAFVVILVLDLGAPGWLVAAAGALVAVAGHFALRAVRERLVESTAARRRGRRSAISARGGAGGRV